MVKKNLTLTMVGLILTIVSINEIKAQHTADFAILSKYRKLSIFIGPKVYSKAKTYVTYGDYRFTNKLFPGLDFGFEYDFHPEKKWSITTGLIITKEPIYNITFHIFKKDLYPQFTQDWIDKAKSYSIYSFSVPILYQYKFQTSNKSFITLSSGFKLMYYPTGTAYFGFEISNEDQTETREIFGLKLKTQDYSIYESFILNPGFIFVKNKILFKPSIMLVLNFQNIIEGEYQFGNLLSSPPARGKYELSGNYLALQLAVNFKVPKRKWMKVNMHLNKDEEPVNLNK